MINYEAWNREYSENKEVYSELFDKFMIENNYENVDSFEKNFAKYVNRKHIVSVSNATDALRFSLLSLGIGPGDEVLVTDFSWIATSSCISMVGATPVFCDIDVNSYHISPESIQRMYSKKTKAIIYTHLFGNMTDTAPILEFCKQKDIAFIEDAAQSLGSSLNGIQAGTLGDCSSFSFNSNKVICGINGGGVFMTDKDDLAHEVRKLRRHGKDKDFESLGYNSKMYTLNAQIILLRMNKLEYYQNKRQNIANMYNEALKDLPIHFQLSPQGLIHNHHKYTIRLKDKDTRKRIKDSLQGSSIHYEKPLSENSMYKNREHRKDNCLNSKLVANTIISLPIHPWLAAEEVSSICSIVRNNLS